MITRRSLVVLTVDAPWRCKDCGPDVSPHDVKRELKYLRCGVPVSRFVCAHRFESALDDALDIESDATADGVAVSRTRRLGIYALDERSGASCKGGV